MTTGDLPPRVGINAVFLRPRMGGLETYVNALVPEIVRLAPQTRLTIFCGPQGVRQLEEQPWFAEVDLETHPLLGRPGLKAASELTLLGALASRRVSLLHNVALTAPLKTRAVNVVLVADLTWIVAPDPGDALTVTLWKTIVPPVVRRADRVITLSRAAANDIVQRLHVPRDRVDVVPLGPGVGGSPKPTSEPELRSRLGLGDGPLILTVSAKRVHKNLVRLVHAMSRVVDRHEDAVLVMPGNPTPHERDLRALTDSLGLARNVAFPAYVDAADLEGLYRAASCFVLASLTEGFGLPILEAMRRGVPVACSRASSLPEVAGDAAEYFDPLQAADIARALNTLLDDRQLATRLARAGLERAAEFSWTLTAERTLEAWARAWRERSS